MSESQRTPEAQTTVKGEAGRPGKGSPVSRRSFVASSAAGVGAAALFAQQAQAAAADREERPIAIPEDIPRTLGEAPDPAEFPMNGAQVFARACAHEGLKALFCAPGNYQVINAIAAEGVPTYGGRTEGSMCAAADGFTRVTGEVAACSGTEGPGFTNMIMNIGAANAARTPLLVLASNMTVGGDDTERGIQRGYQQPTTVGMKKYGKRLITPNRVYEYAAYAFRHLRSGVPRPVHLDFTGEVARAQFDTPDDLLYYHDKSTYRTESHPYPSKPPTRLKAVEMIQKAERPMIVASTGVFYDRAWDVLRTVAERADIAVVESGAMRGHFPDSHPLSASTGPDALLSADLVIFAGQYSMPNVGEVAFDPDVKVIRIDLDAADIGRNLPVDLGLVASARGGLEALAEALPSASRPAWRAELAAARDAFEQAERGVARARAQAQRRHRLDPPRRDRAGAFVLPLLRQSAEGADDRGLRRLRHRPLHPPLAARPPSRPAPERRLPVRRDRPRRRLHRRRRRRGNERSRTAGALSRRARVRRHRRRRHRLLGHGVRDAGEVQDPRGRAGLQQQRLGRVRNGAASNAIDAHVPVPGEPPLRQDRRGPGRPRRVRHLARATAGGPAQELRDGRQGRRLDAHQLPGDQGVLDQRLPARPAPQGRARLHGLLPLARHW